MAVVVVAQLFSPVPKATAGVFIGVFPTFPTQASYGATNVAAYINLINGSNGPQAIGSVTVTELTLVPSCGNFNPTCAGGADPGVFELSATGQGAVGTNCTLRAFNITVIDEATGRVRIMPADGLPLVLMATDVATDLDTCRIDFTFSVRRAPSIDSFPTVEGTQTNQVGYMTVRHDDGTTEFDQGEDVTTLTGTPPPPTTTTTRPTTTTTQPTTTTTRPATTTTTRATTTTTTTRPTTTTTTTRPTTTTTRPTTTTTTIPPTTTTTAPPGPLLCIQAQVLLNP